MINPLQKLNPKIFNTDIEMASMRRGFGEGLIMAGDLNKDIVALCADLTDSTYTHLFKNKYPDRFIEIGIAEQNMASVASGLASMGKIPFITSYAIFSPGRNWEQIRTTICYNDRPVKIVSSHTGVSVGRDGGSHQALEDIAITRVIPNLMIVSPCDAIETKKAVLAVSQNKFPTYIRLCRDNIPIITTKETPFELGKSQLLFSTNNDRRADIGIIVTGSLIFNTLKVAKDLEEEGLNIKVLNLSTIKPLDEDSIWRLAHEAGAIVTVEDHQIIGGMGSAIAECLARHYPTPIEFVGIKDRFGQSGNVNELFANYGLDEKHIKEAVRKAILRKK